MNLRLKEFRERAGLTQADLGDRIGLSHAAVSRLENGTAVTLVKLEKAADVLGVSLPAMFSEQPEELAEIEALFLALPPQRRRMIQNMMRDLAAESHSGGSAA